ncbi:conserved hypothetical protein [Histoplasma capsulatum var. duboisii H88]|uniref:Uncharacterized protein n=1 Tax=Ajellomyces capsulatus (strain H88) TaxID=544711 RepID=F0UR38_AJEC8|nr:conserved hypothetical protein [Histoplasma capsulatum var. duboisii H88]
MAFHDSISTPAAKRSAFGLAILIYKRPVRWTFAVDKAPDERICVRSPLVVDNCLNKAAPGSSLQADSSQTQEPKRTAGALNATRAGCYPAKRQLGDVTVVTGGISMQLTTRFLPLGCPRMRQETSFRTLERRRDIVPSPMANKMHDYSYGTIHVQCLCPNFHLHRRPNCAADARTPNAHQGSKKLANAAGLRQ